MNDYQNTAASPAQDGYAARIAEAGRRYRQLKESCRLAPGAAIALSAIAFGVLTVEMLLLHPSGLSVPLLAIGFEALLLHFFRERAGRDFRLLGCLILLTATGYLLHFTPSADFICLPGLLLMGALQLAVLDGEESPLTAPALLSIPAKLLSEPLLNLALPCSAAAGLRTRGSRAARTGIAIALGMLLALPVCGALLLLFVSADAAFRAALDRLLQLSSPWFTPASLFCDLLFGGGLGMLLAARLLKARFVGPEEQGPTPGKAKLLAARIPAVVSGTFLSCIALFTLLFVGFQFAYLFGGEAVRAAWGLPYSDYARRGFFELCAASALIFGAALLALTGTRPGENGTPRGIRLLTAALCLEDFVILVSALRRMMLYVSAYGLSCKRLLALWGMAAITTGLILLLIRCKRDSFGLLRALLIAGMAAICLTSLSGTERIAAGWNARQMIAGTIPFDSASFQELGFTAAPQLEKLAQAFPERREEIDRIFEGMRTQMAYAHPLYSFTFDRPAAAAAINRQLGPPSDGLGADGAAAEQAEVVERSVSE